MEAVFLFSLFPSGIVSLKCYDIARVVAPLGAPKAYGCFSGESWRAALS